MATFNAYEVAARVGVRYPTLMRWVGRGLLNPEGARAGHRRATTWRDKDLREASVLAALRRAGFSMQKLKRVIEHLRSLKHNPLSSGEFIAIKTSNGSPQELVKICDTGEAMLLIREPGQLIMPLLPIKHSNTGG